MKLKPKPAQKVVRQVVMTSPDEVGHSLIRGAHTQKRKPSHIRRRVKEAGEKVWRVEISVRIEKMMFFYYFLRGLI